MNAPPLLPLSRDFLGKLDASRHLAYPFFKGLTSASALSGPPAEFDGHRPYIPGDDIRWIDWNLYARLEELYVKVFHVEEDVEVFLFVDSSISMNAGTGLKYRLASACAAALSYLAILTQHSVHVCRYADGLVDRTGPARNMQAFLAINELLLSPAPEGGTDIGQALSEVLGDFRRNVSLIVISDGFQTPPFGGSFSRIETSAGSRIIFLRIADEADLRPSLKGNIVLEDQESGTHRTVYSDAGLEKALHKRIDDYFHELESELAAAGIATRTFPVDLSPERIIFDILLSAQAGETTARV